LYRPGACCPTAERPAIIGSTLDWVGLLLASPGVALLTFGLAEIPGHGSVGHPTVYIPIPLLTEIALPAVFIWRARRVDDPSSTSGSSRSCGWLPPS
jgi:hypothetical protein